MDKAGIIYSSIGGLVAGSAFGAIISILIAGITGPWLWGLMILFAVGLYAVLAVPMNWLLPGRASSLAEVVRSARTLSGQMMLWSGDLRRRSQSRTPRPGSFDMDIQQMLMDSSSALAQWNERFLVDSIVAFDRLIAHGAEVPDGEDAQVARSRIEHPTNPLGMEYAAQVIGVMAARLEAEKLSH